MQTKTTLFSDAQKTLLRNVLCIFLGFSIPLALSMAPVRPIQIYFTLFIFALSTFFLHFSKFADNYKFAADKIIYGMIIYLVIYFMYKIAGSYKAIPEWDFLCFYLFGKVGISGSDFYNPEIFLQHFNNLKLQALTHTSYMQEIVNVAFWYPPPSMLLFLVLGALDLQTGYFIWQTAMVIFLVVDIILMVKLFNLSNKEKTSDLKKVFPVLLLILLFPGLISPLFYSQTLSVFLFFLILTIRYLNNWKAGIFLALLIIIKPLAAIFVLYFIFFKKWNVLISLAISGVVLMMITGWLFGFNTFIEYFKSPPTDRIPEFVYLEGSSIFSTMLRLQIRMKNILSLHTVKIICYAINLCLVIISFLAVRKRNKTGNADSFIVFVPLALLVYPGTLGHYIIILIPVILYIYQQAPFKQEILNLALVFVLYVIAFSGVFLFSVALWIYLVLWFQNNKVFSIKPVMSYNNSIIRSDGI
jgi:Glycosyltransferase family 87